jgi:hypothetical protein
MKKYIAILGLIMVGCFSKSALMTQDTFSDVQVGTPIQVVIDQNGEPYSIDAKNGMDEYHYIERVTNGNRLIYETHFILYVRDGVVVGKTSSRETPPAYNMIYQDDPNHNQYP